MKLRTKFALLVTSCTLLLLGSYYLLSVHNASNAIVNFAQESSVKIGRSILDDDDLMATIEQESEVVNAIGLKRFLLERYPNHYFVIFEQLNFALETFSDDGLDIKVKQEQDGLFSYKVNQPGYQEMVVTANRPPEPLLNNNAHLSLFWVPKNLITSTEQGQDLRKKIHYDFIQTLVVLSIAAIALSWLGAWYFLRPLKQIRRNFKQLADGQLDTRIDLTRNDEVGEIIVSFNQLADWLQTLHRQYKQMSSDLSHELKTPLTSMQSRVEALEDGLLSPDSEQFSLLARDIQAINKVVEDLCLLSLTESKQLSLNTQACDVGVVLKNLHQMYKLRAEQLNLNFVLEIEENCVCHLDVFRFDQIIKNLIDNALKYANSGQYLKLQVQKVNRDRTSQIQISVIDKGPGLSSEQQQQIFQRFYRAQSSRHDRQSLGLGLPICKQLTELMKGELSVSSDGRTGSQFNLYFKSKN